MTIFSVNNFSIGAGSGFGDGSIYRNGLNMIEVIVNIEAYDENRQSYTVKSDEVTLVNWMYPDENLKCIDPDTQKATAWSYYTSPNEFCTNSISGEQPAFVATPSTVLHYYIYCPASENRENITIGAQISTIQDGQLTICNGPNGYRNQENEDPEPGVHITGLNEIFYTIGSESLNFDPDGKKTEYDQNHSKTEWCIMLAGFSGCYIKKYKANGQIDGFASQYAAGKNGIMWTSFYRLSFASFDYDTNRLTDWCIWMPNDNTTVYPLYMPFTSYTPSMAENALYMTAFDRYTGVDDGNHNYGRSNVTCVQLFDQYGNNGIFSFVPTGPNAIQIVNGLNYGPAWDNIFGHPAYPPH